MAKMPADSLHIDRSGTKLMFSNPTVENDWRASAEAQGMAVLSGSLRWWTVLMVFMLVGCIGLQEALHVVGSAGCVWKPLSIVAFAAWGVGGFVGVSALLWIVLKHERSQRQQYVLMHRARLHHVLTVHPLGWRSANAPGIIEDGKAVNEKLTRNLLESPMQQVIPCVPHCAAHASSPHTHDPPGGGIHAILLSCHPPQVIHMLREMEADTSLSEWTEALQQVCCTTRPHLKHGSARSLASHAGHQVQARRK